VAVDHGHELPVAPAGAPLQHVPEVGHLGVKLRREGGRWSRWWWS
jgi:hypothetical protein